jgi:hypothetical protein
MIEILEQRRLQLAFKSGWSGRGAADLAFEHEGGSVTANGQFGDDTLNTF